MDVTFIKVLNMSISASWLVLAVLVLRLLLKKSPKWIHVALWALVAVRLVCPFSIESILSLVPSAETIPETIVFAQTPAIDSGVTIIDQAVNDAMSDSLTPQPGASVNPVQVHLFVQENLWCLGMAIMLGWAWISYLRLKKKVAASLDLGKGLFLCDYIDTPFILGILRPKIYLPSGMDQETAAHVLSHEQAHIARKDHWWKPFGYLLLTIHWFNPLMWLAYILLCRDIELACDEKVIRDMESPQKKAYSEALLNCSIGRRYIAACPLAFGEVGVKERVRTVLNYRKPAFWIVLLAILVLVGTAIGFLTDPVERTDRKTAQWFEEYAYEQVSGRMGREEVVCLDAREGYALVYCKGQGPMLTVYRYEKQGDRIEVISSGSGSYTISGGMSLNHLESGGKHIYFGTISEYHYNPRADLKTWLNWDYLTITDESGKTHKQDMTGKEGFLFVLDKPLADFQAVDGLGTIVLNRAKFEEQGYALEETWLIPIGTAESPFGRYYRAVALDYLDGTSSGVSRLGIDTSKLFLLTEGYALLSLDAMDWSQVSTVAQFSAKDLPEDFADLFLKNADLGTFLRDNTIRSWEFQDQRFTHENDRDVAYLLQHGDGALYLVVGSRWVAQYREGQSNVCRVYKLQNVQTDDPFAESGSPYQWTLNLREEHIRQVQVYQGQWQNVTLSQREFYKLLSVLNCLTREQITQGSLKHEPTASLKLVCQDADGPDEALDVVLQYDGSAVRLVFSEEAQNRYPRESGKEWIVNSVALNDFLAVYTEKQPEEDPFSDPDNAYRWCRNIRMPYMESAYVYAEISDVPELSEMRSLKLSELLRILNALPESAFEKAAWPEKYQMEIDLVCRNVRDESWDSLGVALRLAEGEVYFRQAKGADVWYQTWKISSHALAEFIAGLQEEDRSLWYEIPLTGGIGLGADSHSYVSCDVGGLEMSIPELDCFAYQVSEEGIRFKPENVEGWILLQYRTEPFAACGTGLVTSKVGFNNDKYTGIQGYYDGNKAWSFISLTMTSGDVAYEVVFLNEETAPWVTEYFYEIVDVISELSFLVTG